MLIATVLKKWRRLVFIAVASSSPDGRPMRRARDRTPSDLRASDPRRGSGVRAGGARRPAISASRAPRPVPGRLGRRALVRRSGVLGSGETRRFVLAEAAVEGIGL